MPIKAYEFPEKGELVMVKIKEINPNSAIAVLLEYPEKEGMIPITEVARKWVKDIRRFIKLNQICVARVINVDEEKNFILLSLKRVSEKEKERKIQEYRREEKAEKMLEMVANELGITLEKAYEEIGFWLQEEIGEMYKGFLLAMEKPHFLIRKGLKPSYVEVMKKVAERAIEIREREFKLDITLRCYEGDGIKRIKRVLLEAMKKFGVEVKYIAAPNYRLVLLHKDPKKAEKMIEKITSFIEEEAEKNSCEVSIRRVE